MQVPAGLTQTKAKMKLKRCFLESNMPGAQTTQIHITARSSQGVFEGMLHTQEPGRA